MIDWIKPSGAIFTVPDNEANNEYLSSIGFKRKPIAPVLSTVKVSSCDADKGDGVVGSYQWRCNWINTMSSKVDLANFIFDINSKKLDQRGSIEKVRAKAIALLESE